MISRNVPKVNEESDRVNTYCPNVYNKIEDVKTAYKTCKKNKACGNDEVYYENFIFGGKRLTHVLTNFFNAMSDFEYCPALLKMGVIITLRKGGNKKKCDPNSYRATCILSLFNNIKTV